MKKFTTLKTLLVGLLALGATSAWADNVTATLEHTAGAQWGSNTGVSTVDAVKEHYNNDASSAWAGCAYAKFSYAIPSGHSITKATLTYSVNQGGSKGRDDIIYYMKKDFDLEWTTFAGQTGIDLRNAGSRAGKAVATAPTGGTGDRLNLSQDVTDAVKAIYAEGQNSIIFQWTGNAGGADLYGKGSSNAPTLVIVTANATSQTKYKVKFTDGTTDLKDPVEYDGTIGESVNASDADKASFIIDDTKYVYKSGANAITLASDAASNVITLTFEAAPSYTYSVVDNFGNTIASGSAFEGDDVYFWVPYYAFKDNKFYKSPSLSSGTLSYAQGVITAIAANTNITVTYQEEENTNVVFYSEAENLEGVTALDDNFTRIRMSNGKAGYFAEQAIFTTLPAGTYRLTAATRAGSTTFYAGAVGEGTEIASISSTGSVVTITSDPFTLTTETGIYASVGSQTAYFDYVIIEKVPQQFTYTVNAVNENEQLIKNIAEGSADEGGSVTVPYNKYILVDGKLLVASGKDDGNKQFSTTFTLTKDYEEDIIYKESGINDVVFYAEGEDITGCTVVSAGTISQRGSGMKGGAGGSAEQNLNITKLPEGRYIVTAQYGGKSGQSYTFKAGDDEIISVTTSGATLELVSSSIVTLSGETALTYFGGYATTNGTNAHGLDFVYVQSVPETVPVTISDAGYATYINSKYPLDFSSVSGLTAYTASINGSKVEFPEATTIPANTGVLLKGAANTYQVPVVADGGNATSELVGGTTAPVGSFVLMNESGKVGFYKTKAEFTLGANTAYIPSQLLSREFIAIDGEATAIKAIETNKQNGEIFNLAGQRVNKAQKGLYIQNGKKVIIK